MPNLHPMLVHLPIALLTASWLFDLLAVATKKQEFERTAWWTLIAGSIGLAGTIATGLAAEGGVAIGESARRFFETHEQLAFGVAAIYSVVLLWRFASRTRVPSRGTLLYFVLTFLGVALVWGTAWYGGELVFRFGVGVGQ